MKSSRFVLLVSTAALAGLALLVARPHEPANNGPPAVSDEQLDGLRSRVERETVLAEEVVARYRPAKADRIDDLAVQPEGILRGLPGVVSVEVPVRPARPTRRIVHLRDLHLVPMDLFALDVRQAAGRLFSNVDVGRLYEQHLLETELIQIEQVTILRCLARRHGLRTVRIEGLTAREVPLFRERMAALKEIADGDAAARRQLGEIREMLRSMDPAGSRYRQGASIEKELLGLVGQSRPLLLEVGAAGKLLMAGEIDAVLHLDDEAALNEANPVTPAGRIRIDAARVKQREDAIAGVVLDSGPFSLIILGGAHDLSESVRRLAGDCEYVRVTTRAYREFQGR